MNPIVRRVIGEGKDDETRTYTITARPDHLDKLEQFLWWVDSTRGGHSGAATLAIDGDGAARVKVERKDGELKKPDEEIEPGSSGGPEYKVCLESLDEVKPVLVKTRQEEYHACPHCGDEIHEKHTFVEGYGTPSEVERHSDCGGAIKWPPTDWSKISPEWRKLLGH